MSVVLSTVLLASLILSSCAPANTRSTSVTIAAASDLAPLGDALQSLFLQETGVTVVFSFGSSGALARQIEHGAPFDLYLSANEAYVRGLEAKGLLEADSVRLYALGRLGIWYRQGGAADLDTLRAEEIRRIALPNPQFAPYGVAARDLLERAGLWEELQPKIIYGENVRQTAQFAVSGNVDAAISSWNTISPLNGSAIPPERHAPIRQAAAVIAGSSNHEKARQILEVLTGDQAKALFREHGFTIPTP